MKQETLEEAVERLYPVVIKPVLDVYDDGISNQIGEEDVNEDSRNAFIDGANYQAETMYSEDEVIRIARESYAMGRNTVLVGAFNKWLEKFKKS